MDIHHPLLCPGYDSFRLILSIILKPYAVPKLKLYYNKIDGYIDIDGDEEKLLKVKYYIIISIKCRLNGGFC